MGRGRAKAKQTKVARELKYREFTTDFSELQRELHGGSGHQHVADGEFDDELSEDEPHTDLSGDPAPHG